MMDLTGEMPRYRRQGRSYLLAVWLVSVLAILSNGANALLHKFTRQRNLSLREILWQMGRSPQHVSSLFVDRFCHFAHAAKCNAASWRALDLFYHYDDVVKPQLKGDLDGTLARFWIERMHSRQASPLRLHLAARLIADALCHYQHESVVRMVCITSGSAEAVIKAIIVTGLKNVQVVLIEKDKSAIEAVQQKVNAVGLTKHFTFVHGSTRQLETICATFPPHIIEMIGFLDCRSDAKAIELVQRAHRCLRGRGIFFTGNVHPNPDKIFLDWVLLWPMFYRRQEQLAQILVEGGFDPMYTKILYEPFHIHGVAICRKE